MFNFWQQRFTPMGFAALYPSYGLQLEILHCAGWGEAKPKPDLHLAVFLLFQAALPAACAEAQAHWKL